MDGRNEPDELKRSAFFRSGHAAVTVNFYLLNTEVRAHSHDFVEIAVVCGGEGVHSSSHGRQRLEPGDTFVFRPGVWHAYLQCRQLAVYNCLFGPELLDGELAWYRNDPWLRLLLGDGQLPSISDGFRATRLASHALKRCLQHLDTLVYLTQNDQVTSKVEILGYMLLFLSQVARAMPTIDGLAPAQVASPHPAVVMGVRLLNSDLTHPWTLSELACQLHIDRSYLVRLFKASTGLTPMAYLARQRAERAAELLVHTNAPVHRIAELVGWPDSNYFARRFRTHFGECASAYRARRAAST
jgi:AraC family L-rhamnose operon transcriptional activator RhaR